MRIVIDSMREISACESYLSACEDGVCAYRCYTITFSIFQSVPREIPALGIDSAFQQGGAPYTAERVSVLHQLRGASQQLLTKP